jgi:arginine deiminase
MVHRPGLEHSRLTPSNARELLFDDVLRVSRAQAEHDAFCAVMREHGAAVFEIQQLLAEAPRAREAKDWVCRRNLNEREVGVTAAPRAREGVEAAEPGLVAEFLIGGITRVDAVGEAGLRWEPDEPVGVLLPRCRTSCSSVTPRAGSTTVSRSTP